ncbi:putative bifunctional diguanylate cyclase/phosphodiesterase [Aestuariivirga sp.]|uniref:putative bifunctional diguanylate cyclase/phosphodiesterase n=1 Tax=Aestuariivirga sp. TaxID=2650926 RepID=UPI0039E498C7
MSTQSDKELFTSIASLLGCVGTGAPAAKEPEAAAPEKPAPRRARAAKLAAEPRDHYQSLFDNAVCGIYRDKLDGTPVRANRALYTFNGYNSEEEHLAAVVRHGGSWYVDPDRANYFRHLMETQGHVRDLVSEVYRHRSKERAWITENAWYVRNANGEPLYIEGTIQDATERVLALAEVERQANTDMITGAVSRTRFLEVLHDAMARETGTTALLTVDLDKFKQVNDLFGHSAGDLVLRIAAKRLAAAASGFQATVARLGGDEFAIVLENLPGGADLSLLAAAIVESLRQPIEIEGHNMVVGASVGVAVCPTHTRNAKELLSYADLALYDVKERGRNDFCLFNPQLKARYQRRQDIESELRTALSENALELYYQPIIDAQSHELVSLEALMRWNHPRNGRVSPAEFIPLAEEAGLMPLLGDWTVKQACRQIASFPEHIKIAVNISPSQLRSAGIVKSVREALAEAGMAPSRLVLEMTETAIFGSEAIVSSIIQDLLGLGVSLALDDFGTGYSSLSYLQRYAFSEIKIDRSFVAGIGKNSANLAIIRGVIAIARDMNMHVVAEGIEEQAQADALAAEGCDYLQGYLFGKPMPLADIATAINVGQLRRVGSGASGSRGARDGERLDTAPRRLGRN